MLGKLAAAACAGTVVLAGLAGGAWGSRIPSPGEGTCEEVLQGGPTGGAHKETDPPDGSAVAPGDEIEVTITWAPATLPVTGADPNSLLAGAGADLAVAGLAVIGGTRRRAARRLRSGRRSA